MNVKARAINSRTDVRDRVGYLELRAVTQRDVIVLTRLYRHIAFGAADAEIAALYCSAECAPSSPDADGTHKGEV